MNCFFCEKGIRAKSPNKHKVGGQWAHKVCPGKTSYRKKKREKLKKGEQNEINKINNNS